MPVIVAPSTQVIPPTRYFDSLQIATVALNTGDSITWGHASSTRDPGVTRTNFNSDLVEVEGGPRLVNASVLYSQTNVSFTYTATRPIGVALVLNGGGEPQLSSHGTAFGYFANTTQTSFALCEYGTELQTNAQFVYYLTPELVQAWCLAVGMPWLAIGFTAFYYTTFNAQELCGSGPPPFPEIDISTLDAASATWLQILKAVAWPSVCRCKAGTPTPIPYPPPTGSQPTGWPTPPVFGCTNADLCATLLLVQKQLAALSQTVASVYELQTVTQRYGTPFAYQRGARHPSLSGSGAFQVPRIVGIQCEVLDKPDDLQTFTGAPEYVSDLGWLSLLTNEGLLTEIRLTRSFQVWSPESAQLATQIGFALREGVTVAITELYAEA